MIRAAAIAAAALLVGCTGQGQWDGASCEESDDCNSGLCATVWNGQTIPGGVCTYDCWATNACPYADMACVRRGREQGDYLCLMRCAGDHECREGWRCGLQPLGVCIPE